MRQFIATLVLVLMTRGTSAADGSPRSVDPRFEVTLFAEQPQIATPTGIHVDARGRVWAIECNSHFRPSEYPGHPTDRVLIFADRDGDGRAEDPVMFADGFIATMSVAVRPPWLPAIQLDEQSLPADVQQVFIATRNQIVLLEDLNGDDVSDRQTVLFHLDTRGDYPHNGFAGFAFDPFGHVFVGMGENLGEPYKVVDRHGAVVFESGEGGNIYRFRPDGTDFKLFARGFWNPHASCVDAFGRMFMVDNDPDSRPPCRLMHVIEGGDYGYRFANGRKGLHPFTSWDGQIPGTLPMVAGTGEAPSGVIALEHAAIPEEYRGDLLVTSWGDHRIDRFKLQPRGASFTAIPEPLVVGGEDFRPVGIAQAPDGSLYCTDWVKADYELHGHGRIWRIAPIGMRTTPPTKSPPLVDVTDIDTLASALLSPNELSRRIAAHRLLEIDPSQLVTIVRNPQLPERTRYEALAAMASRQTADVASELQTHLPVATGPFDAVQTLLSTHFGVRPPVSRALALLDDLQGSDPMYALAAVDSFRPVFTALGENPTVEVVELANRCVTVSDPFARSRIIGLLSDLPVDQLIALIDSPAPLATDLRVCAVLAARKTAPRDDRPLRAALQWEEPTVRRAASQWAAEERLTELRPMVEGSLQRAPMTTDLFLASIAALEMLDGKAPVDFDRTPSGKYVVPLLNQEHAAPAVIAAALQIADPADPGVTPELLARLLQSEPEIVRREALRTLCLSPHPASLPLLISLARIPAPLPEVLSGLSGWLTRDADNGDIRNILFQQPASLDAIRALRGLAAINPDVRTRLLAACEERIAAGDGDSAEYAAQAALVVPAQSLSERLRQRLEPRPTDLESWKQALAADADPGDAEQGRILFHHPQGPGCSKCHTIEGRGGRVGPDLSRIGGTMSRDKLIESILDPSREVSPQYTSWQMVLKDGRVMTGMIVHENLGATQLGDSEGRTVEVPTSHIDERRPQRTSVMPERLSDRMTVREFRHLLTFLQSLSQ